MRIRALNLAESDEAMLRLFVKLRSRNGPSSWVLHSGTGADVTLSRPDARARPDAVGVTIWVLEGQDPTPADTRPFVHSPLQFQQLAEVLDSIAEAMRAVGRHTIGGDRDEPDFVATEGGTVSEAPAEFAPTRSDGAGLDPLASHVPQAAMTSLARLKELELAQRRIAQQVRPGTGDPRPLAPVAADPAAATVAAARPSTDAPDERGAAPSYRLVQWPSHALLGQHPSFERLAQFLGARHRSLPQLVQASGVAESTCARFIETLRAASMLDVRGGAPSDTERQASNHTGPAATSQAGANTGVGTQGSTAS
jgi:hypothetical protein